MKIFNPDNLTPINLNSLPERKDVPTDSDVMYLKKYTKQGIDEILKKNQVAEYQLLETSNTGKSIYGSLELNREKYFYKIRRPNTLAEEILGYQMASEYPHKKIVAYDFNEEYGIYLQEYCEEVNKKDGLLINAINGSICEENAVVLHHTLLKKIDSIFDKIVNIYEKSLNKQPYVFSGSNDAFFSKRLLPGGRLDTSYANKKILFRSSEEPISFEKLMLMKLGYNDRETDLTILQLVQRAREKLNPLLPRYFILSQGDLTETNITLQGNFFDFETGGINSLIQDIAIFCCYSYLYGPYIQSKYSDINELIKYPELEEWAKKNSAKLLLNTANGSLNIDFNYQIPEIRRKILRNYVKKIICPIENIIKENGGDLQSLIKELQSALFMRLMFVKNILKYNESDLSLILGLIAHFLENISADEKNISDFVINRFTDIKNE